MRLLSYSEWIEYLLTIDEEITCPFCLGECGEWEGPEDCSYWRKCIYCEGEGLVSPCQLQDRIKTTKPSAEAYCAAVVNDLNDAYRYTGKVPELPENMLIWSSLESKQIRLVPGKMR